MKELKSITFMPIFKFINNNNRCVVLTDRFKRVYVSEDTYASILIGQYCTVYGKWFKTKFDEFGFTEKGQASDE